MISHGIILGLTSSLAFGLLDILIAFASRFIGMFRSLMLAQAISTCILLVYFMSVFTQGISFRSLPLLLFVGVGLGLVNSLANVSLYNGLAIGPVALVSQISASYGLVTTLLAVWLMHEVLSLSQSMAVTLILMGVFLSATGSGLWVSFPLFTQQWWFACLHNYKGLLFALGSMLGFGVEFFYTSIATVSLGPEQPIFWSRLFSVFLLLIYASYKHVHIWKRIKWQYLGIIVLIALLDTLGMVWYNMGTRHSATSIVVSLSSTYALIPTIFGIIIYRERLKLLQWLGVGSLMAGIVILSLAGG